MITRVLIHKSPTFEHLELELQQGFNVFSGISGSGKSVFLHAILSAFGFKESNAALVEVNAETNLNELGVCLDEFGISDEESDGLVVSVLKKQNVRYFLNNQAISKKKLNEIARLFIKYISIKEGKELEHEYMLHILDSLITQKEATFHEIQEEYRSVFLELKQCRQALHDIEEKQNNIENLRDFAQFEIDKITALNLQPGEYEKLMQDKKMLSKKEKVMELCQQALNELDRIDKAPKALELLGIENAGFFESVMEARGHIENGLHEFQSLELEPEALLERLSVLADIKRKYGSEEAALNHLATQQAKLKEYENIAFDKTQLEAQCLELEQKLHSLAATLYEKRASFLPRFTDQLNSFATQLKLEQVALTHTQTQPNIYGIDMLEISLATRPKSVLSSGEYNRMRLAMLCVAAKFGTHERGILILDEIDANLSGEESEGVAKLLQFLSKQYQIFAISHQPFMPLLCDTHYLVSKTDAKASTIKLLNKKERIKEIARMISGSKLDQHALSYAATLLQQQDKESKEK